MLSSRYCHPGVIGTECASSCFVPSYGRGWETWGFLNEKVVTPPQPPQILRFVQDDKLMTDLG